QKCRKYLKDYKLRCERGRLVDIVWLIFLQSCVKIRDKGEKGVLINLKRETEGPSRASPREGRGRGIKKRN
ncbi:MAG: hypothetical protein K6C30_04905, partial [Bacteroidaceae bacterium]|nr:hypothetical protein [Bacteroidaceae bacterium]